MTSSVINRFSHLGTDPLRSFRFYAEFLKPSGVDTFSPKIKTGGTPPAAGATPVGKSTGFYGGFTNISGLNINTQAIQYREGGYNTTVHQIPGMTTFQPITMQRGVLYGNDQAMTWMKGLFAATAGEGIATTASKSYRVDVNLYVMDHPNANATSEKNIPRMKFQIHNAWITGLNYSDLNAADGALLFETMTLVHEGMSVGFTKPDQTFTFVTP